jgi:hypothetical protein
MYKEIEYKTPFYTSPKSEALYQTNQGPDKGKNKAKPKPNHHIFTKHRHGPSQEAQRSTPTKDGLIWSRSGCGRIATELIWPQLWSVDSTDMPKVVH